MIPLAEVDPGHALAQAIVDTVREPLLVLNKDLRVIAASRSFYVTFEVNRQDTQGTLLYELGDGQWDSPVLKSLLEKTLQEKTVLEDYEVEHDFPHIGRRIMLLNARQVFHEGESDTTVLLAIEDVTKRRAIERDLALLLTQKQLLLEEMQHRIANSLQIIASILMLKARSVQSDETRGHLQDAHSRVMSVASVQMHLQPSGRGEPIEMGPYLKTLCASLASSMIGDTRPIFLETEGVSGTMVSSEAVSIGLIVTESVINALKHAFPHQRQNGEIVVKYDYTNVGWILSIADNGVGKSAEPSLVPAGLGTSIVNALAQQLNATVKVESSRNGTRISIVRDKAGVIAHDPA